ncbi:hypothetical protein [Streptomyces sp. NPDC005281]|uniref:effector-associated constant component EACC1 n=1 Tax=Streptomyces sp. NPDC005281 TaxID=3155712 RepID=UPI0033A8B4B3
MSDPRRDAVLVFTDEADPEGAEDSMSLLAEELSLLDLSHVRQPTDGPAPDGTRAGQAVICTTLLVGTTSAATLRALVALVQDWLARRNSGSIDMTIDGEELRLTSVSRADQRRAVELFVARHAAREADLPDA